MTGPRDRAAEVLAEALGLGVDEISDDTKLGVTPQWESLAHMRLVLALEQHIDRRLTPAEIVSITSLQDVVKAVESTESGR